ncbi:MAG: phage tail sheath family protein [Candidatus Bathyarchaeia archaeon]|jgi:phage tail sheath protein FI
MIRQFKQPGVYVEEVSFPLSIQGVSTSTAAFIGETQKGPSTPTLITSWQQFQTVFGSYFGEGQYLPYSVEGFFLNGGPRCYIRKVTGNDYTTALTEIEKIDSISLIYVPNAQAVSGLTDLLIDHCEKLKNRFVIIDSIQGQSPSNVSKPKRVSSFAALYYPWIQVRQGAKLCFVPPGGHIAGVYARTDTEHGVHKAPANQPVNGAVGLEFMVSDAQQGNLNLQSINCIRKFVGKGILVWGARTLSSDPEFKYVNVRRLLIYLEQSISKGTKWVVFESNNQTTWAKIKSTVDSFLSASWQAGMLTGTKPQDAYFVRCDRSTITQNDIDNGKIIVQVGVAPVKPAEFMIFSTSQKTSKP